MSRRELYLIVVAYFAAWVFLTLFCYYVLPATLVSPYCIVLHTNLYGERLWDTVVFSAVWLVVTAAGAVGIRYLWRQKDE